MKVDVMIAPMSGPNDPPPIAITIKNGRHTLIRVEMTPEDFALAITGRLVHGTVTKGPSSLPDPDLRERQCLHCGGPFPVGSRLTGGKREDAKFCSLNCRVAFNRAK